MRILLKSQLQEKNYYKKLAKQKKKHRAICATIDAWHTELMLLPLNARISKVAYAIARETIFSLTDKDICLSVSLCSVAGLIGHSRSDCVVLLTKDGKVLSQDIFSASTRAAAHFLTLLQAFRPSNIETIPLTQGSPISQHTQSISSRDPSRKVFEQL